MQSAVRELVEGLQRVGRGLAESLQRAGGEWQRVVEIGTELAEKSLRNHRK